MSERERGGEREREREGEQGGRLQRKRLHERVAQMLSPSQINKEKKQLNISASGWQ